MFFSKDLFPMLSICSMLADTSIEFIVSFKRPAKWAHQSTCQCWDMVLKVLPIDRKLQTIEDCWWWNTLPSRDKSPYRQSTAKWSVHISNAKWIVTFMYGDVLVWGWGGVLCTGEKFISRRGPVGEMMNSKGRRNT